MSFFIVADYQAGEPMDHGLMIEQIDVRNSLVTNYMAAQTTRVYNQISRQTDYYGRNSRFLVHHLMCFMVAVSGWNKVVTVDRGRHLFPLASADVSLALGTVDRGLQLSLINWIDYFH